MEMINCDQDDDDIYFDEVYFCLTVCHEKSSLFALPPSVDKPARLTIVTICQIRYKKYKNIRKQIVRW